MKFITKVQRIQRSRPGVGWFLTGLGFILPVFSVLGAFLLFGVADFSSQVRDEFERPPGAFEHSLFALALLLLVSLFVAGLILIWARVRRYDAV